jgi:ceramide glucosyltransferase
MDAWSLLLIPVVGGSIYSLLSVAATAIFMRREIPVVSEPAPVWPAVSVLKPVYGLEKDLEENLRSTCTLDYPDYQVVLSVQRTKDPALPLIRALEAEFGPERVTVVVGCGDPLPNGKIQNLIGALAAARHEILVISDSDVLLHPGYLQCMVAPLEDPQVGYVCSLYRGVRARRFYERLELLSLHDFIVSIVFAETTGASDYCLGSSLALRRKTLDAIGGFEPLASYLVEDFEMGRRIQALGLRPALVPLAVDTVVDLQHPSDWWKHQLYWDQNTRAARPVGFFATLLIRAVPFALLYGAARLFDPLALAVLTGTLALRLVTTAATLALLGDREGLRSLHWLPLRDIAGLACFVGAMRKRTVVWRGVEFGLTEDWKLIPPS